MFRQYIIRGHKFATHNRLFHTETRSIVEQPIAKNDWKGSIYVHTLQKAYLIVFMNMLNFPAWIRFFSIYEVERGRS